MVALTLVDHLRLTFGHVVYRHQAHAREAHFRARWSRWLRAMEALLMTGVALTAAGAAYSSSRAYTILSAVLAVAALGTLLLHLTFDWDSAAQVHAACASRLWRI